MTYKYQIIINPTTAIFSWKFVNKNSTFLVDQTRNKYIHKKNSKIVKVFCEESDDLDQQELEFLLWMKVFKSELLRGNRKCKWKK